MDSEKPISLPHGARGIDMEGMIIEFLEDKVILISRSTDEHYTVEFGQASGILDIHRTWRDEAGKRCRVPLFAIRHEDLPQFMTSCSAFLLDPLLKLIRPLRVGWLARNQIGIVKGLDPISNEDIAAVTKLVKRRRLALGPEKFAQKVYSPDFLEELSDLSDGAFSLIDCHRRPGQKGGIGLKTTDFLGRTHLHWLKLTDLTSFSERAFRQLIEAAQQYASSNRVVPRL